MEHIGETNLIRSCFFEIDVIIAPFTNFLWWFVKPKPQHFPTGFYLLLHWDGCPVAGSSLSTNSAVEQRGIKVIRQGDKGLRLNQK